MRTSAEWRAWSTNVRLVVDRPDALDAAVHVARETLREVDEAASRFRADSELMRLAERQPHGVVVSDLLAALVARGLEAARLTDGLVDPALGRGMDAIGYDRDIRLVLDDDRPVRAVLESRESWRRVRLEGSRLTVPSDLALDLGATAKAVTADRIASDIAAELECGVLISLGGDVSTSGPEPEDGWNVLVQDGQDQPAASVRIAAGTALATSSTIRRRWRRGEEVVHHILDPRTGRPAAPVWRTVSVAARSCFRANALATAGVIRGASAPVWLAERASARLVAADGSVVTVGGWPAEAKAVATPRRREGVRHG
jgi:FAD:protein FMN transferase